MRHDVIICTRDRPDDLVTALDSITRQTRMPTAVIVVDASEDDSARSRLVRWSTRRDPNFEVRYVRAAPGLPAQRNLGARSSNADVLHYLDDDVVLESQYLEAVARVFEDDPAGRVVGAGGLITNQPSARRPRLWWRLALLDSKTEGVVLRSGANIIVTRAAERMEVGWLSGCSMSFRADLVRSVEFDEELSGYALMEDVDFGFRASKLGQLILEPEARLVHNVSPIGRWDHQARQRAATYRRGWFVEKNLPQWCMLPFGWSVIAGSVVQFAIALGRRERWGLRVGVWRLKGGLDFVRGKR